MEDTLEDKFYEASATHSDIYQHMETLYTYSLKCKHITECGVRNIVSSYAFALALSKNDDSRFIQVDPYKDTGIDEFHILCSNNKIDHVFYEQSDLECPIENTDLLFIDTWHVYAQLKRELERWNMHVKQYIIMHDTTVDGEIGESIRRNMDIEEQVVRFGYPKEEIEKGLWPAVEEFLVSHPEWRIEARYFNNNGLTILARIV